MCGKNIADEERRFRQTIITSFEGGGTGYLGDADDIGVPVREFDKKPSSKLKATPGWSQANNRSPEGVAAGGLHTVLVVFATNTLLADNAFMAWIDGLCAVLARRRSEHAVLIIQLDADWSRTSALLPNAWTSGIELAQLGEYSIRDTVFALMTLNAGLRALTEGSAFLQPTVKLFVSHAKLDGQPLARAIASWIEAIPDCEGFYDADDIPPGADFAAILEREATSCILIVLRTGVYETREWCVRELTWADQYACPYITVDLRNRLFEAASTLPFHNGPEVRIPDGNLFRVIFAALREGLRARIHVRIVQALIDEAQISRDRAHVLVRRPTSDALFALCNRLDRSQDHVIVYPDPVLEAAPSAAAQALVAAQSKRFTLTTPQTLAAMS